MTQKTAVMDTDTPTAAAAAACAATLAQCAAFVRTLDDEAYGAPSPLLMGSSVGQHVRHSLDHVAAILTASDGGLIDYDHRERGTPVESDRAAALEAISKTCERLATLSPEEAARRVRVRVMLSGDGDVEDLESTVGRELAFAAHHETHHHAMMAAIAAERGLEAPEGFGKAPSTLRFEAAGR